jgi:hypothetical protein
MSRRDSRPFLRKTTRAQPAVRPTVITTRCTFRRPCREEPEMYRQGTAVLWPRPVLRPTEALAPQPRAALCDVFCLTCIEPFCLRRRPALGQLQDVCAGLGIQVGEYLRQLLRALLYLLHPCSRLDDHRVSGETVPDGGVGNGERRGPYWLPGRPVSAT